MKRHIWKRKGIAHPQPQTIGDLLKAVSAGQIQHFGPLSLIPLLAKQTPTHRVIAPLASLRWESAPQLSLKNDSPFPAILPMQLGYLEYGLPSQSLCETTVLGPESERSINNAASLSPPDASWNLMLPDQLIAMPHMLRHALWASCGERSVEKIWPAIIALQNQLGWENGSVTPSQKRICAERIILIRQAFVLQPQQIGYLLLWEGKAIALEMGPTGEWWSEWFPRLCDNSIAPLTFGQDFQLPKLQPRPRQILSQELAAKENKALERLRKQKAERLLIHLHSESLPARWRYHTQALHVFDITEAALIGQVIMTDQACTYASLFAPGILQISKE
ncbi:MAG: hypothetical protein AAF927_23485 [Bacteroidota bacterium]